MTDRNLKSMKTSHSATSDLPKYVTRHDIYKTCALLLMLIDHIGYYFFPDFEVWCRVIGRMSAPIWLFLVGYASSRALEPRLIGGAVLIISMEFITGHGILPLNILITFLIGRMLLNRISDAVFQDATVYVVFILCAIIFALPAEILFTYGMPALFIMMWGHYCRRYQMSKYFRLIAAMHGFIAYVGYAASNCYGFEIFEVQHCITACVLIAFVFIALYAFTPGRATSVQTAWLIPLFHVCGRRTLEIYVMHLLLFMAIVYTVGLFV